MTVLALIGIKVALNTITSTVSLMTDYYVLTDREIKHLKVWTHKTNLPPLFPFPYFCFYRNACSNPESERSSCVCV